jgi:hypothetical protein
MVLGEERGDGGHRLTPSDAPGVHGRTLGRRRNASVPRVGRREGNQSPAEAAGESEGGSQEKRVVSCFEENPVKQRHL